MKNKIKGDNNGVLQVDNLYLNQIVQDNISIDDKAIKLLKETVEDEQNPRIIYIKTLSGRSIQCGNSRFSVNNASLNEREMTYWEDALDSLIKGGYVKDVGYKNEIFKVTKKGYDYYDSNINLD